MFYNNKNCWTVRACLQETARNFSFIIFFYRRLDISDIDEGLQHNTLECWKVEEKLEHDNLVEIRSEIRLVQYASLDRQSRWTV